MKNKKSQLNSPKNKQIEVLKNEKNSHILDIFINVHIKNKVFKIYCGEGQQRIKWLMDVALLKFDNNYGLVNGKLK